jgi:hypothetical protein
MQVSFVVQCADGTKPVASTIDLGYCVTTWSSYWTNSGQECNECQIPIEPAASTIAQLPNAPCEECSMICEMAPSPIVPGEITEHALSRVHSIKLRELARVGRSVVLQAIHDGPSIDWQVDAGTLQQLADDIVVWTANGCNEACITTTVQSADGLAVSSLQLAA